ncbi:MAG: ubiquinone/menaquinone biosynthesis C-methylase UbiE [Polyangiales bacterium]|jgi:ubiquinone/menaquinone biosynthesis C-methylase UbiE
MYEERAAEYDALIGAEDADGTLRNRLLERVDLDDKRVADIGAGTGRLARWVAPLASHIHLVDRAKPMLEVARTHLKREGHGAKIEFHAADARELPLDDDSVDIALAGWVFGHFRHWMPEGWKVEVDTAIAEMQRIVVGDGPLVVIETLGTGHESPRQHTGLDEYFVHLESMGFEREWVRTDYVFADAEVACETMGAFFGAVLVAKIRANRWSRVPECTAIFLRR